MIVTDIVIAFRSFSFAWHWVSPVRGARVGRRVAGYSLIFFLRVLLGTNMQRRIYM